jgi:hypothetical protein
MGIEIYILYHPLTTILVLQEVSQMSLIDMSQMILHNWQSLHEQRKSLKDSNGHAKFLGPYLQLMSDSLTYTVCNKNIAKCSAKASFQWSTFAIEDTVQTLKTTESLTHLKAVPCWSLWNKCWLWNHSCCLDIQQVFSVSYKMNVFWMWASHIHPTNQIELYTLSSTLSWRLVSTLNPPKFNVRVPSSATSIFHNGAQAGVHNCCPYSQIT